MQLNQFKVLDEQEISKVHQASLEILSEVGMVIYSKEVLELLNDAGAIVNFKKNIANRCIYQTWLKRGSPDIVENARKKVKEILRVHQPKELDISVQKEIKRIIKTFESQIQKKKL